MPVKSDLNWDLISELAFELLPAAAVAAGWSLYFKCTDQEKYFSKLNAPNWVISNQRYIAPFDVLGMVPVGYAANMIFKQAASSDRSVALALYTSTWAIAFAALPAFYKSKDLKTWFGFLALHAGSLGATAIAFYKINNNAGMMLIPMTAWLGYQAAAMGATMQANPGH